MMSAAPEALGAAGKRGPRLQRGAVLGVASVSIGVLTTLSGVVIELASDLLADLRHGVCVARLPGDTRPLWEATLDGGWRPYDRMRCCGGSASVDHASEECRAQSIIRHSIRKRIAYPVLPARSYSFGSGVDTELLQSVQKRRNLSLASSATHVWHDVQGAVRFRGLDSGSRIGDGELSAESLQRDAALVGNLLAARSGHAVRAAHNAELVGADSLRVRGHISRAFESDLAERWAEEGTRRIAAVAEEAVEVASNEDVAQTQSESAGSLAPVYEWVPWERLLMARGRAAPLLIYVAGSGLLAAAAAIVTRSRPQAKGSGIPEVKASVAGFAIPRSFQLQTLTAKMVALSLCVGAGIAVGKEGPMIHIGACWGALLASFFARFIPDSAGTISETELTCVGAAAGVSAAFGAPLGGVLFVVEELGPTTSAGLRYSTMICCFGSAVLAALTLKWLDLARTERLTLFEVDYKQAWAPWEAVPFCILGVLGGALGGAFVLANEAAHRRRLRAQSRGQMLWYLPTGLDMALQRALRVRGRFCDARVLEVVLIAIFTCASNYPHQLTRMLQNDAIIALFAQCPNNSPGTGASSALRSSWGARDPVGLCSVEEGTLSSLAVFLQLLLGAAMLRMLQASVTFGALVPAGLFVPSLYVGGCVGRALGLVLQRSGLTSVEGAFIEPGIYAMVGAGAMLAGVSRLTISLVVVLFELTGGLTYVVPFMLAVLIAKWTGDAVTNSSSVYDIHAELNGLTKVEPPDDVRILSATLQDLRGAGAHIEDPPVPGPPVLWLRGNRVLARDLEAQCRVADDCKEDGAGFAVLALDAADEIDVLGWVSSTRVLAALSSIPACEGRWCRLAHEGAGPSLLGGKERFVAQDEEDFSHLLEGRGAVRVRSDCPVQTAFCIFRNRPTVRALVAVEGSSALVRTVTRESFEAQIRSGRLHAAI